MSLDDAYEKIDAKPWEAVTLADIVPKNITDATFDNVTNPSHYDLMPEKNVQVIDVIRAALTEDEYRGYCKGNRIKYSLRGGKKDGESERKDAGKARQYIDFQLEE